MYIDGEWVHTKTGEKIDVVNPTTERVIGRVPRANREEVKEALEAARDAQPKWEDTSPIKRASFLFKIAQLIRRDKERLAEVLTAEQGKPLFESRLEIEGSAENFEYYAEYARRIQGDVLPSDNPRQSIMILKLPLAWCGCVYYSLELSIRDGCQEDSSSTHNRKHCCHQAL